MGEGFNVDVSAVRSHAQTVGTIAGQVRTASSRAQESVSGGAFGQIAEFFASAVTGAANEIRGGIEHASQTVNQVESGLNQAADAYQAVDERHAQLFNNRETGGKA